MKLQKKHILKIKNLVKTSKFFGIPMYWVLNKYYGLIKFLTYGISDMFLSINIETTTICNRRCSHCPNSIYERGLSKNEELMDEHIFRKIIDELAEIGFEGRISPHHFGEPLMDKRLVNFVEYTRKKLPKSKIFIVSNGDFLTPAMYDLLVDKGVDTFLITQHSKEMPENIKLLFYHSNQKKLKNRVVYNKIKDLPLGNRGGLIKIKSNKLPRCLGPRNPLVIDYAGNIVLCCSDYFSSVVFGNVKNEKLMDIWKSNRFKLMRQQLRKRNYTLEMCKKCAGFID